MGANSGLSILLLLAGLTFISAPASAVPKIYTDAEMGQMREDCRQEVGKMKSGKKEAVGACVRRKKGKK